MITRLKLVIRPLAAAAVLAVSACGGNAGNSGASTHTQAPQAPVTSSAPSAPADSGSGSPPADSGSAPAGSGSGSAPAGSGSAPSQSGSQYLDGLTSVAGGANTGSVEVNGQYYADSVYLYPSPGSVSYNLGRQWRKLQATVGLSDDSPENEKVRFQIFADQKPIYDHVFVLGQSQQINLNVSGVLRLVLVATLESADAGSTEAVWGNAILIA